MSRPSPRFWPAAPRIRRRRRWRALLSIVVLGGMLLWVALTDGRPREGGAWLGHRNAVVLDGDSFRVAASEGGSNAVREIRLDGIDAPEFSQQCRTSAGTGWPCGEQARNALRELLRVSGLECTHLATDRYGRSISRCRTSRTPDIAAQQVRNGWAVVTGRGLSPPYAAQEEAARTAARGIWRGEFDRPADWRARHERGGDEAPAP